MENTINLPVSHSSNPSPETQNETTDNKCNLINNLASVSISPNELPIKKELQQNHNVNDSSNRPDSRCPDDLSISNNFNQYSEIKDNSQYHTYTKERFKALRQYLSEFAFPDTRYLCGGLEPKWYFTNYIQKFTLESQMESDLSFDPAGNKKLQILNNLPFFEETDEETDIDKNILAENRNLEPTDHAQCYPEKPLDLKDCSTFKQIINAIVKDLDADILNCEDHELRLNQGKR